MLRSVGLNNMHVASCSFLRTGVACCLPTCTLGLSALETEMVGNGCFWAILVSSQCHLHMGVLNAPVLQMSEEDSLLIAPNEELQRMSGVGVWDDSWVLVTTRLAGVCQLACVMAGCACSTGITSTSSPRPRRERCLMLNSDGNGAEIRC